MNEIIVKNIWCLTSTGVWSVSVERHHQTIPTVCLISAKSQDSFPQLGTVLMGGSKVAITASGVVLYYPSGLSPSGGFVTIPTLEETDTDNHGQSTGEVIAYFLLKEKALQAQANVVSCREYEQETIATLRQIGANHPVFIISRCGQYAFPVQLYDQIGVSRSSSPRIHHELVDLGQVEGEKPSRTLPLVRTSKLRTIKSVETKQHPKDTKERKIKKKKKSKFPLPKPLEESKLEESEEILVGDHIVRSQSGLHTRAFMLQDGKYEVEEITHLSPTSSGTESWYIIISFKPNRIIGNTVRMLSHWLEVPKPYLIKKTTENGRIFLETSRNFWVKEIVKLEQD